MSPIGGVGINMAVQDAVAAANRLAGPLKNGTMTINDLHAIQERRTLPVRFTQWFQLTIQKRIISRVLGMESQQRPKPPLFFEAVQYFPGAAPYSSAVAWDRYPARTYSHAGSDPMIWITATTPPDPPDDGRY